MIYWFELNFIQILTLKKMKKTYLFLVVISLLFVNVLFAQDATNPTDQEKEDAIEKALTSVDLNAQENESSQTQTSSVEEISVPEKIVEQKQVEKNITAIEVKGNKSISTNIVIAKLKLRVGALYHENVASEDLKRLYALKFFEDIKFKTQDYKDGVKVVITVVERPVIEKITFSGVKKLGLKDDKLKEKIVSKENLTVDYPSLEEDLAILKGLYEKKGYGQVKVEHELKVNQETNKAIIDFKVDEGKKKKVKKIYIEGNYNFSDGKIIKILKTKKAWLFGSGVLAEEVLIEDMDRIKSFYNKQGFINATVDYKLQSDARGSFWLITINIEEGKKFFVGDLIIKGNQDVLEKEILAKIQQSKPGKVFSQEYLKQDIMEINSLYFDKGYISARVQETTTLNDENQRIDVTLNVKENEVAYVEKIKIKGNVKTRDAVIRRELRIKPGDRFDGQKLKRSKERLQNLGFFEEVGYDTEDTEVSNKKDLIVEVKESKTGQFSFGGGYSTVDQFVGFVEVEQKNFDWKNFPYFTGAGQDLKLRASLGSLSNGYELSFTEPWIFDYPLSFGFDIYKNTHERDSDVGYGYDEDITGGDLRFSKEFAEYLTGSIKYTCESIKIANVSADASNDLKEEEGKNTISSTEVGLTLDTRDNVFEPKKGDVLSGSLQMAGGPIGGDRDFWKFYSRASHYWNIAGNSVLEFRVRAGIADTYDDTNKIPIFERFFAGGANTIRGYRERKIGPYDSNSADPLGGEAMLIGNMEYTYPLFNFLKLAAFYDIGNVWARSSDFAAGGYKSGVGFGFRLKTPIGPIMLDYGIPLNKESGKDTKDSGRIHFSMSHGF